METEKSAAWAEVFRLEQRLSDARNYLGGHAWVRFPNGRIMAENAVKEAQDALAKAQARLSALSGEGR